MLLRIEVFLPEGKGGMIPESDNPKPSQTLYACPATVANRRKLSDGDKRNDNEDDETVDGDDENNGSDPNAGLVATIGRKGDVDILFGTDKSISRQHALLRFVAPRSVPKNNAKRRATTRGKNKGDREEGDNKDTTTLGCFMEPRDEDERSACEDSPCGMCLVLENKGKSGSYIPSEDKCATNGDHEEPNRKKDDTADDSDATMDDEGIGAGGDNHSSQQRDYGTATSLSTQLGEIIVSRKNMSPSQKLPSLSATIQHHFGRSTPVKLTKIDADESRVLKFHDVCLDGDKNNETTSKNPSILIQFGCALLPTIKITKIPMTVVFSSGVLSPIQNSLRLCGGLSQEAGTPPRGESETGSRTTHLVTPERMAVAKQLIAWCYGVPIVSPDFLLALADHSDLKDPFPLPSDFPAKSTDTNAFWEWTPDPNLLSNYIMISVDPLSEVEQAEALAVAAGAKVERFYDKKKKHTKARVQALLKQARSLLETASDDTSDPQQQQVVLLSAKAKSKWSNTNTTLLLKQLKEDLLIPTVNTKILAKTITQQESVLVGLEPISSANNKSRSKDQKSDPKITSEAKIVDDAGRSPVAKHDVGETERQLRRNDNPNLKRKPKETTEAEAMKMESKSISGDESPFDDGVSSSNKGNKINERNHAEEIPSQSRKRRKVDSMEQEQEEKLNTAAADNEDSVVLEARVSSQKLHSTTTRKTKKDIDNKNGQSRLERADANGWFKSAPKDDHTRARWRRRASEAYETKTGIELESSASSSGDPRIHITAMMGETTHDSTDRRRPNSSKYTTTNAIQNRGRNNRNVPNFKSFRKNFIPMANLTEEVVVLVDSAISQASQRPKELSAEELELRENERIAEALFKGDPALGMAKRKRQRRN